MKFRENASEFNLSSEAIFPFLMVLMTLSYVLFYQFNKFIFISIAGGISAACCAWLTVSIFRNRNINIIRLVVYQSVLWYFLPLAYYTFLDTSGLLVVTEADMAESVLMITVSLSIGWCFSFLLNIRITFPLYEAPFLETRDLLVILIPICLFQLVLIATGAWSYETTHASASDAQAAVEIAARGPAQILAGNITPGIAPMVAYNYGLLPERERNYLQKLIFVSVIALESAFWLLDGRRALLVTLAISAIAFSLGRMKSRFTLKQLMSMAVVALILGFGLAQANKLFYTMRMASNSLGGKKADSISDFITAMNNIPAEQVSADLSRNLAARPFIIESVGVFLKTYHGHLYGKELLYVTIVTIPSVLFPGKDRLLAEFPAPEALWNTDLDVPLNDYANSLLLDGYADFSYLGFLIYAGISGLLFLLTFKLASLAGRRTLNYLCIFGFIFAFLQVETSYGAFLIQARDFALLFAVVAACNIFLDTTRDLASPASKLRPRLRNLE